MDQTNDFITKFSYFSWRLSGGDGAVRQAGGKRTRSEPGAKRTGADDAAGKNQDLVRQFAWAVASINVHLQEIRYFWAKTLGISGPQWMILMALADLDKGEGVSVKVVSKMLHVDPSFVTTQSKLLEKNGFMRRRTSEDDARVVQMSLTDKTYKHIASLASQQQALNDFIFAEFGDRELTEFTAKLTSLKNRLEKASLKVAMDI
jgi:MarR family transcriptional regulator, organic hydroperoxide resistance regulator